MLNHRKEGPIICNKKDYQLRIDVIRRLEETGPEPLLAEVAYLFHRIHIITDTIAEMELIEGGVNHG